MFFLILLASCITEIIVTLYTRAVAMGYIEMAVLSSGLIRLVGAYLVVQFTKAPRFIAAAALGEMAGTFIALKFIL